MVSTYRALLVISAEELSLGTDFASASFANDAVLGGFSLIEKDSRVFGGAARTTQYHGNALCFPFGIESFSPLDISVNQKGHLPNPPSI